MPTLDGEIIALNEPNIDVDYSIDRYVQPGQKISAARDIIRKNSLSGKLSLADNSYDNLYQNYLKLRDYKALTVRA